MVALKTAGGLSERFPAEYNALRDAVRRCHDPDHKSYHYYGQRGISVCDRWRFGESGRSGFELFLLDVGERPSAGLTLDREDNSRGYEPGNCHWATWSQQASNKRRNGTVSRRYRRSTKHPTRVTIDGVERSIGEWCQLVGVVQYATAFRRIERGWDAARAVSEPVSSTQKEAHP